MLEKNIKEDAMMQHAHGISELTKVAHEAGEEVDRKNAGRWNDLKDKLDQWANQVVAYSKDVNNLRNTFKSCECPGSPAKAKHDSLSLKPVMQKA